MNDEKNIFKKLRRVSPLNQQRFIIVISSLIYLFVFTLPFPLTKFYRTIPPVDYTKLTNYSQVGFLIYIFGLGTLFALFVGAIRLNIINVSVKPYQMSMRMIFAGSLLFSTILLFSYPLTAIDLFIYAIRSRGWALYSLSPFSTSPEAFPPTDPWLGLAGEWIDAASPYGPLWEIFSLGAFYLSGGSFLIHLFLLKLIGLLAYLGCVWLIYRILTVIKLNWAVVGTVAFAWNPLVLFESVQNAHNDILMMFFFLAAIWVVTISSQSIPSGDWKRLGRSYLLFCLLAAASVLVKFVTILVIPFFLITLAMRQQKWLSRLAVLGVLSATISTLIIVPMMLIWPGWENWAVIQAGSGAGRSLLALLILGLRDYIGTNPAFDLSRSVIHLIFAAIYLHQLWWLVSSHLTNSSTSLLQGRTDSQSSISQSPSLQSPVSNLQSPVSATFHTFFWYVLLAAPVFHAWYLLWFLPAASLLLSRTRPLTASIVFSITALMVIPYFETIRVWYPFLLQNHFVGHLIAVPLLILPPALTLLWSTRSTGQSEVLSS